MYVFPSGLISLSFKPSKLKFGALYTISAIGWVSWRSPVYGSHSSMRKYFPPKTKTNRMMHWKKACPKMCLTIFWEMMYSFFLYGGLSKRSYFGSSVARASEARESMIRLTQRSWIAWRGESHMTTDPIKDTTKATTLTVSWNWRNLLMLS